MFDTLCSKSVMKSYPHGINIKSGQVHDDNDELVYSCIVATGQRCIYTLVQVTLVTRTGLSDPALYTLDTGAGHPSPR